MLLGFWVAKTGRIAKKKNKYVTICLSERRKREVHGAKDKTITDMEEDGKARELCVMRVMLNNVIIQAETCE